MCDDAGVDSTREEEAVVDVGHHAFFDGGREGGTDFVFGWLWFRWVFPGSVVFLLCVDVFGSEVL